tara:strand:+ start:242 stop:1321 length:1080 start_codon:yes stop_codon:yes gene_type:complete
MSTSKHPHQNEEVDLGQLFKAIGKGFEHLFQFIVSIFKQIFMAFVWFVFFVKRRRIILLISAAAGIFLGFVLEATSPPIYKSTISLKQNYPTGENLYGSISYYNGLLKDQDYKVLGNLLGLDESSSRQIVAFDIEPVITDNEYLVMFDKYITSLDSLTAARADYDDYIRGIKQYKHPFQQISIKSKTRGNFNSVFAKIVDNVKTNTFFVNEQAKDISELRQAKAVLEKSLVQSDSLQNTYKRVLEQQMNSKSTAEIGITFEGSNDRELTREYDLYKNDIQLRREIVQIERDIKDKENIIDMINSKQDSGFVDNNKEVLGFLIPTKLYCLGVVLGLVFFLLLSIEFLRFLEKYNSEPQAA